MPAIVPTALPWTQFSEAVVGHNHPTLPDVDNRPLRQLLTSSGYNPDTVPFTGFLGPMVNVRAFGAAGDGVTDDTAAMQAAHNTGQLVYYPAGTYKFTFLPTGFSSGGIVGDGPGNTILLSTDTTTAQVIPFTGRLPVGGITSSGVSNIATFRGFTLYGQVTKTSGAGIQVIPPTGESSYMHFENVVCFGFPICIDFVAASFFKIIGCDFLAYTSIGVQVANTNNQDSGDSAILGCTFNDPTNTTTAILQHSSGGLRVIGNKLLGGLYGYQLAFNPVGNTGNLQISGNSVEQMATAGIYFSRVANSAAFKNIMIAYNEFGVQQVAIASDASGFLNQMNIVGNVLNINGGGSPAPVGITLTGVTDVHIAGNLFRGNGGSSNGVILTSCTNGRVGPNYYDNLSVANVTLTTCTNVDQWDANASSYGAFSTDWRLVHAGSTVLGWNSTTAAANQGKWRAYATAAGQFVIDALNDAENTAASLLTLSRSGANATGIGFGAATSSTLVPTSEATLIAGIDARGGNIYQVTLTAARLVAAPTNLATGERITFSFIQGGAGAFAVTWNAIFKGLTWSDTGNATGARSSISFVYDGTNLNQDGAQAPYHA